MTNIWLLAARRHPGRTLYQDLTPNTWNPSGARLQASKWWSLAWGHCLEYGFQLREEAVRIIRTAGPPHPGCAPNEQHRMEHWVNDAHHRKLPFIPSLSFPSRLSSFRKETCRHREDAKSEPEETFTHPRKRGGTKTKTAHAALPGHASLPAHRAYPAQAQQKSRSKKPNGEKGKGKGKKGAPSSG